jgi:alpha-galactosidase/6-phospho-beta-glucosidase family protein
MKDYSEFGFREHGVMLYLDKTLYKAFIRLQADKGLGRSYAGLLAFVEGLFHLGFLAKEDYQKYVAKYSQELTEEPKPLTLEEQQKVEQLKQWQKQFRLALNQIETMPSHSKEYYLKKAEELQNQIPEAKQFIEKCREKP